MNKRGRVTWKDVAERAGVSPATVSVVLGDKADSVGIATATRQRVIQAAEDLGYFPNLLTRSIRAGKTDIFGLLVDQRMYGLGSTWWRDTLLEMHEAATADGYELLLFSDQPNRTHQQLLGRIMGGLIDGLFVLLPTRNPLLEDLARHRFPTVVLGDTDPRFTSVTLDYEAAMESVVDNLVALGHRQLAYYVIDVSGRSTEERLAGVERARVRHGLPPVHIIKRSYFDASSAIDEFMATSPRATALIAFNDDWASRAYLELQARGIRVPDDVSIVGFDGLPHVQRPVQFSTMVFPVAEMCRRGLRSLESLRMGEIPSADPPLVAPFRPGETTARIR